jgi:hypothetical protein
MAFIAADKSVFTQGGTSASYIPCPDGQLLTITSVGGTLYYKSTSDVTSSSSDGNITTTNSASFTSGQWVICAQGVTTRVQTTCTEGVTGNLRVGGTLTAVGAQTLTGVSTLTGGVAGGKPWNVYTWEAPTATSGTDTACTNGTAYVGSVFVPMNATVTGIQYLVGSIGGTDKVVASLHDSAGALLANSALAGATVGTAAQVQQVALTATYAAVGPAFYFVGVTFNGATAKFRSVPAHTQTGVVGNGVTQTFGTAASFTAPTTFSADKVPVASLY